MELLRRLRRRLPYARVIILTNLVNDRTIREVLQEGACGYLLKSISADELVHAIRAAFQGTVVLSPEAAQVLLRGPSVPNQYHLTPREYDVLNLLVQGWNNHDIAKALHISLSTVQFHVSNILEKLKVHNRIEAATLAVTAQPGSPAKAAADRHGGLSKHAPVSIPTGDGCWSGTVQQIDFGSPGR